MASFADDKAEVLNAVGLTWSDLFDNPCGRSQPPQSALTAGQKLLRDRRNEQRRQRRAEMDNAHASERARELAEAARIAAEETSDQGAQVLKSVEAFLSRFVSYPSEAALVAHVLWIMHTWLMDAWESTPRIAFLSPEPGSGKSRALEVTEPLVPRPVHAVNTTPAYLFRKVADEAGTPTILYDEIDTVFGPKAKDNEDIRGMLNAGHRKGATAGRCVIRGKNVETEELEAYCAVALAGLDDLPDTIMTRSVVVRMRRRAPGERVEPWRLRINGPEAAELKAEIQEWAASVTDRAGESWPDMPAGVEDRDADVWEALLAVADLAGGEWPQRARVTAVTLVTASKDRTPSIGVTLLRDLRAIFGSETRMSTEDILDALNDLEESPWATIRRGEPLDARGLSNRLGKYGIKPGQYRTADSANAVRGYTAASLNDAWQRYLPSGVRTSSYPEGSDSSVGPPGCVTAVTSVTEAQAVTEVTAVTEESRRTCTGCHSTMTFDADIAAGHHHSCQEN
ncbi:DUF3631 domain-containing protein [Gordonia sp. (in: high G+C Gram-positive bacteria)]|uniref:DUF3631 domain-containing protein n=1 Tax=Gordonia sp. (in: high G+C Gram-positive bacteria) TaxID=84139 RepID=UPI00257E8FFF|nr:DUF3631 domain-containing protein [Gordonia sp. (in: high G+C Gram-positive bacteria)]